MAPRPVRLFLAPLLTAAALAGCTAQPHWYFADDEHEHHAEWSYEGETGPAHWGDLDPSYRLAREGRAQSPIDLQPATAVTIAPPRIRFDYAPEAASYRNDGHTLLHDQQPGSWLEIDGRRYALKQLHFHTPSEHSIDGTLLDGEIHLVHRSASGAVAVVAVLVRRGAENPAFGEIHGRLPKEGERHTFSGRVDPARLLPPERRGYHYTGSFTTPPCTEGVEWYVLAQPIEAGAGELDDVRRLLGNNNRPTQPLNGREVQLVEP